MSLKKPKSFGKSVCKHKGYNIRILLKTAGKNEPSGKYAIFAGKKKVEGVQEITSIDAGVQEIETILNSKVK